MSNGMVAWRVLATVTVFALSGCGWLHGGHRSRPPADPSQLIVTGVPKGAVVLLDGAPAGTPSVQNDRPLLLDVTPGTHRVDVQVNQAVVYHEETYVGPAERRTVTVLSGSSR